MLVTPSCIPGSCLCLDTVILYYANYVSPAHAQPQRLYNSTEKCTHQKALFGSYRHVLERREDSILEATMLAWNPYVEGILRAIDRMPAIAEIDRSLLVSGRQIVFQPGRCDPFNRFQWSFCWFLLFAFL